jgi:hypothetical protein
MVMIEANKRAYEQHLAEDFSAALAGIPANKAPTVPVANAVVKALANSNCSKLVNGGPEEKCVVHPKGQQTNKECDKQSAVQAKDLPLYQLIQAVQGVIDQNEAQQAKWQAEKKSGKTSKRKPDKRRDEYMKNSKGGILPTNSFNISATVTPVAKPKSKQRSTDDTSAAKSQGSKDSSKKAKTHVANVLINLNSTDNQKMGEDISTASTDHPTVSMSQVISTLDEETYISTTLTDSTVSHSFTTTPALVESRWDNMPQLHQYGVSSQSDSEDAEEQLPISTSHERRKVVCSKRLKKKSRYPKGTERTIIGERLHQDHTLGECAEQYGCGVVQLGLTEFTKHAGQMFNTALAQVNLDLVILNRPPLDRYDVFERIQEADVASAAWDKKIERYSNSKAIAPWPK